LLDGHLLRSFLFTLHQEESAVTLRHHRRHPWFSAWCSALLLWPLAASATPWVQLHTLGDPPSYVRREADLATLVHRGPWALYRERFVSVAANRDRPAPIVQDFAINCVTGARGTTRYERGSPAPGEERFVTQTLHEIEQHQAPSVRVTLLQPKPGIEAAQVALACQCPATNHAPKPAEDRVRLAYATLVEPAMRTTEFRLRFIRAASPEAAAVLVQRLQRGEPFDKLADAESTTSVFPGGDMGFHAEHRWTPRFTRVFRSLRPGGFTEEAFDGSELYKLEEVRVLPAPSFEAMHEQVEEFVRRADACGWNWMR